MAFLDALLGVHRDTMRSVIAPPALFSCFIVIMGGLAVLAAWKLRHHPYKPISRAVTLVAAWAVIELPTRLEDPVVVGRVGLVLLLSYLFYVLAGLPKFQKERRARREKRGNV